MSEKIITVTTQFACAEVHSVAKRLINKTVPYYKISLVQTFSYHTAIIRKHLAFINITCQ